MFFKFLGMSRSSLRSSLDADWRVDQASRTRFSVELNPIFNEKNPWTYLLLILQLASQLLALRLASLDQPDRGGGFSLTHATVYYLTACIEFGLGTNGNDDVRLIAIDNAELKLINNRFVAHFETPSCWRESEDRIRVPIGHSYYIRQLEFRNSPIEAARIALASDRDRWR